MKLPRFTLRDLFSLVLVAALAVGFCLECRARRIAEADKQFWQARAEYYEEIGSAVSVALEAKGYHLHHIHDDSRPYRVKLVKVD